MKLKYYLFKVILGVLILTQNSVLNAQVNCTGDTPFFTIDLTGNPAGVWVSPAVVRNGSCCGGGANQVNCIELSITLDPGAEGIIFNVESGANPGGALYYQVDCIGVPAASGSAPLCLNGVGPHLITYCKVGNNTNTYSITSVPGPVSSGDVTTADGCSDTLSVSGLNQASVTWNSIFPGASGDYNGYLNNLAGTNPGTAGVVYSNETTVIVTPQPGFPSEIQYEVCGNVIGACSVASFCDTVSVFIYPTLFADINPLEPAICFGSAGVDLTAIPIGGAAPFSFLWSGPSNNGATTETIFATLPGDYTVEITDISGCPAAIANVTVTEFFNTITADAGPDFTVCGDPVPTFTVNGAVTGTTTGIWSGGNGTYVNGATSLNLQYTPSAGEIAAGFVTLTLTTTNNFTCPGDQDDVTIFLPVFTSTLSLTPTDISCFGLTDGEIDLTVTGGSGPHTYLWSNAAVTEDLSGLSAGLYTVTVTDANGCQDTDQATIVEPTQLISAITNQENVLCFGGNNGSVTVEGSDATPGYQYSLDGGPLQGSGTFSGLTAGAYVVSVVDVNGCTVNQNVNITEPTQLTVSISGQTNVSCFGGSDGSVTVAGANGTPGYQYSLDGGPLQGSGTFSGLSEDSYVITVFDANNCSVIQNVTITEPTQLASNVVAIVNVSCFGGSDGSVTVSGVNGTPGYQYSLDGGPLQGSTQFNGLSAGNYIVTVYDINGCNVDQPVTVTEPTQLTSGITAQSNVSCFGGANGSVTVTGIGATPNYSYSLDGGPFQGSGTFSGLTEGAYNVTVNDAMGCSVVQPIIITEPPVLTETITSPTYVGGWNISCNGLSDGSIDLTIGGGTPGYTYLWNTGATTEDLSGLPAGTYDVVATDANGCTIPTTITLTEPPVLTETITSPTYVGGWNISCNGASDGSIDLTIGGGTPGYTYLWDTGATTEDLSGLPAGTYDVVATDANGCTIPTTITLTEPPVLTETITSPTYVGGWNISCNGASDGSIDLTIGGGTPGYTYLWDTGATTEDLSGLPAGTYDVVATDANGCTIPTTITLTEPPVLGTTLTPSVYPGGGNVTGCEDDGFIDLEVVGGTGPYTYLWSNGAVTEDITDLGVGNYVVDVTDANGCTITDNITLTAPDAVSATITAGTYVGGWNVSCNGASDGNIDLSPVDGAPPYTFLWNTGATTEDLTNVPAGFYSVTVTDQNGCEFVTSINLTEPPVLTETITSPTYVGGWNVSCNGASDGSIDLTIGGGTPGYTYLWDTGATSEDISGLTAGTYDVVATDANGCTIPTTITLTEPPVLTETITSPTYVGGWNVSCNGASDGSIDLTIGGGTPGYTYLWDTGATTEDLSGLPAGTYDVVATDANGCTIPTTITLTEPPLLTETITSPTYVGGWNVSCNGASDGSIDLTIGGGTPGYTYLWNTGATTEDLSGLPAGTYDVVATDANGCTIPTTITLTEPPVLTETITSPTYVGGWNISCNGLSDGSIDLTIGGGTPGYTYLWDTGATTEDLSGLPAGTYDVVATDANGCTIPTTITLTEPPVLTETITSPTYVGGWNISCNGLSDGSIDLTIGGGTPGYTYLWDTGATTEDLSGLPAGTYDVVATDANGCTIPTTITLTEPPVLGTTLTPSVYPGGGNVTGCEDDGFIDLEVVGGTGPYTYLWSNGATTEDITDLGVGNYVVEVTDANGCTILDNIMLTAPTAVSATITAGTYVGGWNVSCNGASDGNIDLSPVDGAPPYTFLWNTGATTEDLANVPAGFYSVTVTDQNGCEFVTSINLTEPTILTETITSPTYVGGWNVSCNGASDGSIDLTIGGGTPGYTYLWDTGATTEDLSGLPAGTYDVVATDANGCTIPTTITLTEPPVLTETITSPTYVGGWNISCNGLSDGSIDLTIGGGTPGYTYLWNTGATTEDLSGLPAGTYDVVATDANGCTIPTMITLTEPPLLTETITSPTYVGGWNVSCNGASDGSIDLTIGGGTPGYTYLWDTGATTEDLSGLPAGTYDVVATDANGCTIPTTITLTEPPVLTETITSPTYVGGWNVSCNGASDGSIDLTIGGGTPGYTYLWDTGATTEDLSGLPAGTYDVVATDANGCTIPTTITLTEPPVLTETITAQTYAGGWNISCNGASDGSIDLTIGGGTPGYTYLWNTGATTEDLSGLPAGTYDVVATDANGCTIATSITLTEPPILTVTPTVTSDYNGSDISCAGASDGSVFAAGGGGTPGYIYSWTNAAMVVISNLPNANNLPVGTYTVTITDQNGCVAVETIDINTPDPIDVDPQITSNYNGQDVSCFGATDATIEVTFNGGVAPYDFEWTDEFATVVGTTQDLLNVGAGTYTVVLTDANGCQFTDDVTVTEPEVLTSNAAVTSDYNGQDISCHNETDGAATSGNNGGTPGYTYSWTNSLGQVVGANQTISGIGSGTYDVTITDVNGCQTTSTVTLNEPGPVFADLNALTDYFGMPVSCVNSEDGTIEVVFGGGTPAYTLVWDSFPDNEGSTLSNIGVGNYVVTVFDANGCQVSDNIVLDGHPIPSFTPATPYRVCLGDEVDISCVTDPANTVSWTFSNGMTASSCSPDPFTANWLGCINAEVTITSPFGCTNTQFMQNYICTDPLPNPNFSATPTDPSFITPSTYFNNLSSGAVSYEWNFGDGTPNSYLESVQHIFPDNGPGLYNVTLIATSQYGCIDSITMPFNVINELIFYVPNAFTPNNEGPNEEFKPVFYSGYDPYDYTLLIFNRWGEVIFESHDIDVGWNGTYGGNIVEDGVYIWKIAVGELENARRVEKVGHVTLIR